MSGSGPLSGAWPAGAACLMRAAVVCAGLAGLTVPAQAASEIAFTLVPPASATGLSLANYPAGSLDHGPIDRQIPIAVETVRTMTVTISTANDFDCGTGEAQRALEAANRSAPEGTTIEPALCLFAIRLTVVGPSLARELTAGCTQWQADVSYCWFEGDAGQLWIRRKDEAGTSLDLVFGPFDEASGPESPRAGTVGEDGTFNGVPAHGILIEQGESDLGEAASDLWLTWPHGLHVLTYTR